MRKQKKIAILSNSEGEDKENNVAMVKVVNLNLTHWIDVHQRHVTQIKQLIDDLKKATETNQTSNDYWQIEIDRTNGEGTLFLGDKSKLTQFAKMCNDPSNDKFKVEKEDDLKVILTV